MSGGPGSKENPERITFTNYPLRQLLLRAYGLKSDELAGPKWLDSARYDITAKIQPEATRDELNLMLQDLVKERFHLVTHHATKEVTAYEMVIAKTGLKMPASTGARPPLPSEISEYKPTTDADGFPHLAPMFRTGVALMNGRARMVARQASTAEIARQCEGQLGGRVVDRTGLTGTYDFTLYFTKESADPAPDFAAVVARDLGLSFSRGKVKIDVLVVDSADKDPTDN